MMISSEYKDAIETYYAKDYNDLLNEIAYLKSQNITDYFVNWNENTVSHKVRGVYGLTYG